MNAHLPETCFYCRRTLRPTSSTDVWSRRTRDHYWPKVSGRNQGPANIVFACSGCNAIKGPYPPDVFMFFLRAWGDKPRNIAVMSRHLAGFAFDLSRAGLISAKREVRHSASAVSCEQVSA